MITPNRKYFPSYDSDSYSPPNINKFPLIKFQEGFLPFEEFEQQFNLSSITTEMENPQTANLSSVLLGCPREGLKLLLQQEKTVIDAFRTYSVRLDGIAQTLQERVSLGGRIIFVGVGSSGRLAIDLAAKITKVCPTFPCLGITGGGDCALIVARETFEDSTKEGECAAEKLALKIFDTVILISSSGATSFNVGFGHSAANVNCKVLYFYNSEKIPIRTQKLFERPINPVEPLLLDSGPQAIVGSTRLQAYSLARICLTYLLGQTSLKCGWDINPNEISVETLCKKLLISIEKIDSNILKLASIAREEHIVFSHSYSNFYLFQDEYEAGYVTFLGTPNSIRELIIDSVEIPPTFSLNPYKWEGKDTNQKRPEYQAYCVGMNNEETWKVVLGREAFSEGDWAQPSNFLISAETDGRESFHNRPQGAGNCIIGVDIQGDFMKKI